MSADTTLQARTLQDIEPPPSPPEAPAEPWLAAALLLATLLALGVTACSLASRRNRARRRLRAMERRLARGALEPRAAAFQIAGWMRTGLGVSRIDRLAPVRTGDADAWARFVADLERARYGPQVPSRRTAARLAADARRWLGRVYVTVGSSAPWTLPASN